MKILFESASIGYASTNSMTAQHSSDSKPLLFLVPHYVGSLKYFEKLLPHLTDRYEVRFLIIFGRKSFSDMKNFAEQNKLPFTAINHPRHNPLSKFIPFYITVKNSRHYAKEVERLLDSSRPAKIIGTNDQGFYMAYLMEKAGERNIDTRVLQWALTYPGQRILPKKEIALSRKIIYRFGKPLYVKIRNFFRNAALGRRDAWSKGMIGAGRAKRFGVINEQAKEFFIARGLPEEKITVVGYLDFYLSEKMKEELSRDKNKRRILADKYGINPARRNIIFYSTPFNRKDTAILNDQEQKENTEKVIDTIRKICPLTDFDILFKPHPSETAEQYEYLKRYEVKFMNPTWNNNILIGLSDLYVAGVSTTNFIPLVMGKDAIFVNMAKLPQVESARSFFGIKKFIADEKELSELLTRFKSGNLEKQYASAEKIITPDSLSKILSWIG